MEKRNRRTKKIIKEQKSYRPKEFTIDPENDLVILYPEGEKLCTFDQGNGEKAKITMMLLNYYNFVPDITKDMVEVSTENAANGVEARSFLMELLEMPWYKIFLKKKRIKNFLLARGLA